MSRISKFNANRFNNFEGSDECSGNSVFNNVTELQKFLQQKRENLQRELEIVSILITRLKELYGNV